MIDIIWSFCCCMMWSWRYCLHFSLRYTPPPSPVSLFAGLVRLWIDERGQGQKREQHPMNNFLFGCSYCVSGKRTVHINKYRCLLDHCSHSICIHGARSKKQIHRVRFARKRDSRGSTSKAAQTTTHLDLQASPSQTRNWTGNGTLLNKA